MVRHVFIFCLGGLMTLHSALGAEPSVTAVLSSSETGVGQPVQLEIQVRGAANPTPPAEIDVDGLDIRSAGVSRQYQMNNFDVSYSFTYNYTIMPLRAGTFKIPPQSVSVGGKTLRTPELTLNVASSGGRSSRGGGGGGGAVPDNSANIDPAKVGFIELVLPKAVAYVGEMIPVQVRVGLSTRAPVESLGPGAQIAGQGFTVQKMPEARPTLETINGRTYQVWIFKTAISPVRPGKIEIGPAEINPVVRVPRTGMRNPSLPRDLFDDPFFNNFFNDPAFAPSMPKEINLKSQPTTLDVKPLPPNAPPEFTGAVGTFTLKVDANPKKAQVGDPITTHATVTGRGNFDRVTAPALQDDRGWHSYPATDAFKQDDDVGISGAKTFEQVLSAKENKTKLPPFVFSFFDPVKETYVTLRSDEIPLQVQGGAAPAPTAAAKPTAAAAPSATSTPSATPTPAAQDILYQLSERPARPQFFTPLYRRPAFWVAQLLPLLLLAGFVARTLRQQRLSDREAQRVAQLHHQAAELERRLRTADAEPHEYFADASRAVQLRTALARKVDPNLVDVETVASTFRLDENGRARLQELFARNDELRYSGRNGGSAVTPEMRRETLELIENLRT